MVCEGVKEVMAEKHPGIPEIKLLLYGLIFQERKTKMNNTFYDDNDIYGDFDGNENLEGFDIPETQDDGGEYGCEFHEQPEHGDVGNREGADGCEYVCMAESPDYLEDGCLGDA